MRVLCKMKIPWGWFAYVVKVIWNNHEIARVKCQMSCATCEVAWEE